LNLLHNETDIVEYYGLWSAAAFGPSSLPTVAQIENMEGVQGEIQMGTGLQDFLGNIGVNSQARAQYIRDAGVDVTEYNVDGMHTWDVWRQELNWFIRNVACRATTTTVGTEERGHDTTLTATVAPLGTSIAAPTGKVEFYDGETYLGSAPLTRGVAHLDASVRGVDAEDVTARYIGDRLFDASQSGAS
jgi:hypothetical protein